MSNATLDLKIDTATIQKWIAETIGKTANTYHVPTGFLTAPTYAPVPNFVPPAWEESYTNERLAALALKAALRIESVGWCQLKPRDMATGAECALQALAAITGDRAELGEYSPEFHAINGEAVALLRRNVPGWNDAHGRTADEVINMWLEVATIFEARALASV